MTIVLPLTPSKTHRGENFPVASLLIAPAHRPVILAFYRFARGADDVADSTMLTPEEKLAGLDLFEDTLLGRSNGVEAALPLRDALARRELSPRHALDLLHAFRQDAVKSRYANWAELMDYCAYSAAPVGRFVLDVHGESPSTWPASDALCSALQIINHLQDCGKDYRNLGRVYMPEDMLATQGLGANALGMTDSCPELRRVLAEVARKTGPLVAAGARLPFEVSDPRLCLETAVIARLARRLLAILLVRDPLAERVHLKKPGALLWSAIGVAEGLAVLLRPRRPSSAQAGNS